MLKFGRIRWKNLLSTGNAFTEIDLGYKGTTLIVGANGEGKSTLLDALSFALYGKPFRKINKGQLINSINKKELLVELEFSIGDRAYMIRRGQKPNVFEVYVDGDRLNQDASLADQQDYLERYILKMNHRACMQVVILGSASFVPFMELPAAHRREVLEDILDVRVISEMAALIKPMYIKVQERDRELDKYVSILNERLAMSDKILQAQRESAADRKAYHESNIVRIDARVKELAKSAMELLKAINSLKTKLDDTVVDRRMGVQRRIVEHQSRLNELAKRKSLVSVGKCVRCEQDVPHNHVVTIRDKIDSEIEELNRLIKEAQSEDVTLYEIEKRDRETRNEMRGHEINLTALKHEVENMERSKKVELEAIKMVETSSRFEGHDPQKIRDEIISVSDERTKVSNQMMAMTLILQSLKDDGAKATILDQYVPVINQLINKYLAELDFFVEFELDSEFNEKIKSRHRDDFSYHSFSEGEKMRIDLAILFAWRAIAKRRNSAATNVVIMDEIFDSSLDPTGAEELMKLIAKLTGDTGVVIISHRGDQIADKFDRVIRFEKHSSFSRVV